MEIDPRYRTQRNQGKDDYLEAQLNNMEFSADCLISEKTWLEYQWYSRVVISIRLNPDIP
jgi:hypothetical protein